MFNFLVTAADDAWDQPGYEFVRVRFLEYTSDEIAESFRELKAAQLAALTEMPCLFAYEGTDKAMRVGRSPRPARVHIGVDPGMLTELAQLVEHDRCCGQRLLGRKTQRQQKAWSSLFSMSGYPAAD